MEYVIPVVVFHLLIPVAFFSYSFSWWGALYPANRELHASPRWELEPAITVCRAHRGFTCPKWFEYALALLGVCSFQDSPARWVLVHRVHHQYSDHQPDPHTPHVTAYWAHMGWLFVDNRELSTASAYDKYVRDLIRDPLYMWLQRAELGLCVCGSRSRNYFVGSALRGGCLWNFCGGDSGRCAMADVGRYHAHGIHVACYLGNHFLRPTCGAIVMTKPAKTVATTGCSHC